MEVSFIGSGNLAWHLAPALDNTDYHVREVYSREPSHAEMLVKRLYDAKIRNTMDFSSSRSRIFIIAASDDAIEEIAREISLPEDALLLHTSGSQPLSLLDYAAASRTGVFYPLQTFSKNRKVDFNDVPLFIESQDASAENMMLGMARAISKKIHTISSHDRKALHVAAVFASNFTNHMLSIAEQIMKEERLEFEWLKPLVAETINKALALGPGTSQTGPARRGDLEILDGHVAFLGDDEARAEIYRVISQHIVDQYT